MAFTKAIVLSEAEFKTLVTNEIDNFISEYGTTDIEERWMKSYLSDSFEFLLDDEKVDGMIISFPDSVTEIYSGDKFINWILKYYKIDDLKEFLK